MFPTIFVDETISCLLNAVKKIRKVSKQMLSVYLIKMHRLLSYWSIFLKICFSDQIFPSYVNNHKEKIIRNEPLIREHFT